ncbi:epoxide hydrolase N-terminal domain-containing protein [Rhizorhabdus wittichii]|uniref:epoxide hydrolase N-terminal domain-containing protein n=1 Tax=Rhizorhabdus wittichii TaxID=160791 RepID=UPI001D02FA7F|nr:epoxide hydrolase N-terminal domain-containing protein [Rhizorhabdus wittichii]
MVEPFRIDIPQAKLDRIAAKLALCEVGYAPEDDADWRYGTDARWLAGLLDHWRTRYDWRRCEAALNRLPHFRTDRQDRHPSSMCAARTCPLLLTHGWPGSVLKFLGIDRAAGGSRGSTSSSRRCPATASRPARPGRSDPPGSPGCGAG